MNKKLKAPHFSSVPKLNFRPISKIELDRLRKNYAESSPQRQEENRIEKEGFSPKEKDVGNVVFYIIHNLLKSFRNK